MAEAINLAEVRFRYKTSGYDKPPTGGPPATLRLKKFLVRHSTEN
jgi:hypothetical protein